MKNHYYPGSNSDTNNTTACGRDGQKINQDGHKIGGLIGLFYKTIRLEERCKICNRRFEKDQKIQNKG